MSLNKTKLSRENKIHVIYISFIYYFHAAGALRLFIRGKVK